jgi:hypothetical protein
MLPAYRGSNSDIPVSTRDDLRIGAFSVALVEYINCSLYILRRGIIGQEVLSQSGCVCTADSLAAHGASQLSLQVGADFGTNDGALEGWCLVSSLRSGMEVYN